MKDFKHEILLVFLRREIEKLLIFLVHHVK